MTQLFEQKAACFGCGACGAACPTEAITMTEDAEGFFYPVVNGALCTDCGRCTAACPARHPLSGAAGQAYALRCNDRELLKASTSGGAFTLLAERILGQGGLVCGAVFDEAFQVRHVLSGNIAPMRKAKYVQSRTERVYPAVRAALETGRQVLFTGTPCQCGGLLHYLGGPREGLVVAANICRGVQSPGLWRDYTAHLAGSGTLESYCFRDKRMNNDGRTAAYTANGTEHAVVMQQDPFSRLYLKTLTLRPSCYSCPYTRWELPFDLTMGDFWGIEKSHPELADGQGTSLVITRTEAGRALLEQLRPYAVILECARMDAEQPALRAPAKQTILRKLLFRDYARKNSDGVCDIPLILKKYGG